MTTDYQPPVSYALMYGVILLTLGTGVIHISLGLPLFILNGIGYVLLVMLLYAPVSQLEPYRDLTRYALIAYALLTIILWIFLGTPYTGLGYITKLIELVLIALLAVEAKFARRGGPR